MKETSPEYWFVIYRESKAKPLQVMKVRGILTEVKQAVRNAGYSVCMAFNFDKLILAQRMDHSQFAKHYQNYSKDYYYNFVQNIDVWRKYPKYQLNNIPINNRGV